MDQNQDSIYKNWKIILHPHYCIDIFFILNFLYIYKKEISLFQKMSDQKIADLNIKIQNKLLEIHKEKKNDKKFIFEICKDYNFGHGFTINEEDNVDKVIDKRLRKIYPIIISNMKEKEIAQINITALCVRPEGSSKIDKKIKIQILIRYIVDKIVKD